MTTAATPITPPAEVPKTPPTEAPAPPPSTPPVVDPNAAPAVTPPVKDGEGAGKNAPGDKPGDKPADAPPAKVVPEKYDLKLSEESLADATLVEKIADYAKSQGLSQDEAQAVLVDQEKLIAQHVEAQSGAWLKQAKEDPEIGGEKLAQTAELSKRALEVFDTSGKLQKDLNRFGYGNHPEVLRFLSGIGKLVQEDKILFGGSQSGSDSLASRLYGGN